MVTMRGILIKRKIVVLPQICKISKKKSVLPLIKYREIDILL